MAIPYYIITIENILQFFSIFSTQILNSNTALCIEYNFDFYNIIWNGLSWNILKLTIFHYQVIRRHKFKWDHVGWVHGDMRTNKSLLRPTVHKILKCSGICPGIINKLCPLQSLLCGVLRMLLGLEIYPSTSTWHLSLGIYFWKVCIEYLHLIAEIKLLLRWNTNSDHGNTVLNKL